MKILTGLLAAALLHTASACAAAAVTAAELPVVRVGYFSQLHDAALLDLPARLGKQYRFEYIKFQRYADAAIALGRGDIDVSSLGYANLITEAAKTGSGTQPKFVFIAGLARGAINLVCRKDVAVKQWGDLQGKTIGVVAGFPEIFLDDAIRQHGGSPEGVHKVNFAVAGPPVLQALQSRTTECASVFEPFGATAVQAGYAYYPPTDLADNAFKGINNGVAVNHAYAGAHAATIGAIRAATVAATQAFRQNPDQWATFMATSQGFPKDIVDIGIKHVTLDPQLYPNEAGVLAGQMKALGLIREQPSPARLSQFFSN